MDVTEKIEGVMLREQAQMDGLCQIFNRHYFDQLLQNAWRFAQQQGDELAVIMMEPSIWVSSKIMDMNMAGVEARPQSVTWTP